MHRRQTCLPRRWLIADDRSEKKLWRALRSLPRESGVLFLFRGMPPKQRATISRKLRRLAASRDLLVVDEAARTAVRVHDLPELRAALLRRTPLILLSPLHATRSHPEWRPIPPMRAAAYARLADRRLIALGGMNDARFARIEQLGFQAWAGIDAFRT